MTPVEQAAVDFIKDTMLFRSHTRLYRVAGVLMWLTLLGIAISVVVS